jgi:hypothetical protein
MTDLEFMDHAERLLASVESGCDRINDDTEADIDNQRVGGMMTLTFGEPQPDRRQFAKALARSVVGRAFGWLPLQIRWHPLDGHQGPRRILCRAFRATRVNKQAVALVFSA